MSVSIDFEESADDFPVLELREERQGNMFPNGFIVKPDPVRHVLT